MGLSQVEMLGGPVQNGAVVVPSRAASAPLSVDGDVSSRLSDEVQKRSAF